MSKFCLGNTTSLETAQQRQNMGRTDTIGLWTPADSNEQQQQQQQQQPDTQKNHLRRLQFARSNSTQNTAITHR
jgi:hypothetical protein